MDDLIDTETKNESEHYVLSDGTKVLIENELLKDQNWIRVSEAMRIIGLQDRQVRTKVKQLGWIRRYAKVNKKCILLLNKAEVDRYAKENPIHEQPVMNPAPIVEDDVDVEDGGEQTGKELMKKESSEQIAALLGPLAPHIKDFVDSHKKDQELLRELQANELIREKRLATRTTSLYWVIGISIVVGIFIFLNQRNLSDKLKELSNEVALKEQTLSSKDSELLQAKTDLLNEKDAELKALRAVQINAVGQGTK
jgi:hypothetical protein